MIKTAQTLSQNQCFTNVHKFDKIQSVSCLLPSQISSFSCSYCAASLPACFHLPCFPCGVPQPATHVSLCPRFTLTPSPLCSPHLPLCHLFLLSRVPSTTAASLCGLGFPSRPQGGRGQRAEPSSGRVQSPEGTAVPRPSLTFLQGFPALINQPSTKTADPESPQTPQDDRNEPGCFVPANTAHRGAGEGEEAPHPTRSAPWPPSCRSSSSSDRI